MGTIGTNARRKLLTASEVRRLLLQRCDQLGGQAAFARRYKVTRAYVSQVILGQRPPSARMCAALGIRDAGVRWVAK